jgi:general secretion pathway protein I
MAGMTLIEVLVALAIVAIAMTAVIKATTQTVRGTGYLETKTMAMWVGKQVLNEARLGLLSLPSDKLKAKTLMLGREWHWQASKEATPNKHIDKLMVNVYANEPDDEDISPLISLESYVYREKVE